MYEESVDLFFPLHDDFKVNGFQMNKLFEDVLYMKNARQYFDKPVVIPGTFDIINEAKSEDDDSIDQSNNRNSQLEKTALQNSTDRISYESRANFSPNMDDNMSDKKADSQ